MLLIFDCDGVVLDNMALHNEVESEMYAEFGFRIAPQELNRRFAGVPMIEELRILQKETGIVFPPDAEARIDARKEDVFAERLRPVPGIVETLDALQGIPHCIASGSRMAQLRHGLGIAGLYSRFAPHIFSSELVVRGKPAPDLFFYAARQMNHAPEDCLVIEDGTAGIRGARDAGMRAFGFIGGVHCDEEQGSRLLAAGAERLFSNMRELPELISRFFLSPAPQAVSG